MTRINPLLLSLGVVAAVTAMLVMQDHSRAALRREKQDLRRQLDQLSPLQAENERLSNQLAQVRFQPPSQDELRELSRLRDQIVLLLQDQSNQIAIMRQEIASLRGEIRPLLEKSNQLARPLKAGPRQLVQPRAASTGPAEAPAKSKEEANITYNFPGIPLGQILDIYGTLCGKTMIVDPAANSGQTLRIQTPKPVTSSEAMKIIETALIEQAHLVIVQAPGGALSVAPMSSAVR